MAKLVTKKCIDCGGGSYMEEGCYSWVVVEYENEYHVFYGLLSKICDNEDVIFNSLNNKKIEITKVECILETNWYIECLDFFKDRKFPTNYQSLCCMYNGEVLRFQKTEMK